MIDNEAIKQAQIEIENLIKEINVQETSLTQRHRDLEQESKKVFKLIIKINKNKISFHLEN